MNKEEYLDKLEKLLIENYITNMYTILRDYSNKIDQLLENNKSFDDIIDKIETPEMVIEKYKNNSYISASVPDEPDVEVVIIDEISTSNDVNSDSNINNSDIFESEFKQKDDSTSNTESNSEAFKNDFRDKDEFEDSPYDKTSNDSNKKDEFEDSYYDKTFNSKKSYNSSDSSKRNSNNDEFKDSSENKSFNSNNTSNESQYEESYLNKTFNTNQNNNYDNRYKNNNIHTQNIAKTIAYILIGIFSINVIFRLLNKILFNGLFNRHYFSSDNFGFVIIIIVLVVILSSNKKK